MIVPRRTRAWSSAAVMPFTLVAAGESERSAFVMQSMTQRLPFDWSDLFIIKREAALIKRLSVSCRMPNTQLTDYLFRVSVFSEMTMEKFIYSFFPR